MIAYCTVDQILHYYVAEQSAKSLSVALFYNHLCGCEFVIVVDCETFQSDSAQLSLPNSGTQQQAKRIRRSKRIESDQSQSDVGSNFIHSSGSLELKDFIIM